MAHALELLAPLRRALVPVPAGQPGVCPLCRTGMDAGYQHCFSCNQATNILGSLQPVLPIALSVHGAQFHFTLNQYKRSPDRAVRQRMALQLAALLVTFLAHHNSCLAEWDVIVPVPSPRGVALDAVLNLTPQRTTVVHALTATRDSQDRPVDPSRFAVSGVPDGARVLVLDDMFTSGASLFSARESLMAAGLDVVDAVVMGRHVRPDGWAPAADLMSWLDGRAWSPEHCGRCNGEWRTTPTLF